MKLILIALLLLPFLLSDQSPRPRPIQTTGAIQRVATVQNGRLATWDGQAWRAPFWTGVNLGATTPGHFPGELSPTRREYRRWFGQMKRLGIRAARIYTILPPAFYEELVAFNRRQREPLWLIQGIWSPEEELTGATQEGSDAWTESITQTFLTEIESAVRVIHGDATLPKQRGKAGGRYKTDVSPYLLGWLVGTEWYQHAVLKTDQAHPGAPPYQGEYFAAKPSATPFESWLTRMLDEVATQEMRYGWQHPVAFVNWATTDPLHHPDEPFTDEDLVSVDPMVVAPTTAWQAGYFTGYHLYPYYPDFMHLERANKTYIDAQGQPDPYMGYMAKMRAHHAGLPFLVAEFGLPTSRGLAHRGALGRNQGFHTEAEAGRLLSQMIEEYHALGYDGAFLFAWQDEWHKFTWNTTELELPWERRAAWRNALTNEEQFGLIAVEAGRLKPTPIYLDGKVREWRRRRRGILKQPGLNLTVSHDEAYLYLLVQKAEGAPWDWANDRIAIGFATLGQGSRTADRAPWAQFPDPVETLLTVDGTGAELWINSAYDMYTWRYGQRERLFPVDPAWPKAESGRFLPWQLVVSRPLTIPSTGEKLPLDAFRVGLLQQGVTDPASPNFNSLADWYSGGPNLEIRIPWMLLGFTDPSSHQVWAYPYAAGKIESATVPSLRISAQREGAGAPSSSLAYTWPVWNLPTWHERPKQSYAILADLFRRLRQAER